MHHLDEVPGTRRPNMSPALRRRRRQRLKDRAQPLHWSLIAADHQAVALFQSPYTARGPAIDILKSCRRYLRMPSLCVLVVRVAAINDGVALRQQPLETRNRVVYRIA